MNKITYAIAIYMASSILLPQQSKADNMATQTPTVLQSGKNEYPNRSRVKGKRPTAASCSNIYCSYSREHICFELPAEADFMEVTITDANGMVWSGFASQDEPCCDIPPMASPARIECTVDMTATFTGTLVF